MICLNRLLFYNQPQVRPFTSSESIDEVSLSLSLFSHKPLWARKKNSLVPGGKSLYKTNIWPLLFRSPSFLLFRSASLFLFVVRVRSLFPLCPAKWPLQWQRPLIYGLLRAKPVIGGGTRGHWPYRPAAIRASILSLRNPLAFSPSSPDSSPSFIKVSHNDNTFLSLDSSNHITVIC